MILFRLTSLYYSPTHIPLAPLNFPYRRYLFDLTRLPLSPVVAHVSLIKYTNPAPAAVPRNAIHFTALYTVRQD
jgi:hypothetical protein